MAQEQNWWDEDSPVQPVAKAGGPVPIIAAPVEVEKPREAPSGYQAAGSGLAPIAGGPADPEVIAAQARARKGGEGGNATELELSAKEKGTQRRAETVRSIMGRVEDLYKSDIAGQPAERLGGLTEYISSIPKNDRFNAASNAMLPLIRPLIAQTAKEGDSDKEMQVFMAYIPQANDSDIAIEEKLNMLKTLIGGMVDGKVPSQVTTEVFDRMQKSEGKPFTYEGVTYQQGATGGQPPEGPSPTAPTEPSMLDQISQGAMYGLGDIAQAGGDVLGLVGNPLNATINAATGSNLSTNLGQSLREGLGLPQNPNALASAINQGAAGALTGSLAARGGAQLATGAGRSALEMLGSTPMRDIAGGAGAGGAGQIAAQQGAGPIGQIAAALVGGGLAAKGAGIRAPSAIASQDQALVQSAARENIPLMTSDVAPPTTFVGKSTQFTGERIPIAGTGGVRATQQEARVDAVKRIAQEYGAADPALLDKVSADLLATRGAALTKYATAKDEVISSLAAAGEVPPTNALKAIDDKIAELNRRGTPAAQQVVEYLTRLRTDMQGKSLDQIEAIRKDELSQAFKGDTLADVKSVGEKAIRPIYGALNEDMGAFIKANGERRDYAKWKVSNTRLAQMAGELNITSLKSALRKGDVTPETVGNALFSAKPSDVRALYGNLSPQGKSNARAAILARAVEKAGGLEEVSPQRFANEVARLGASTGIMFTGSDAARLSGLVKVLKATSRAGEASVSTATGQQTYIPTTIAALADIWGTGGAIAGTLATIGGLARVYESAKVRDIMLRLGRTKAGSKDEAFLTKRALAALTTQDNAE